ncbi:MAG TPA: hypothetical protein DCZ72_05130 [Armatimonadetes bacterium]|nr:hypothetical protein [Armatimonadota bacterium]
MRFFTMLGLVAVFIVTTAVSAFDLTLTTPAGQDREDAVVRQAVVVPEVSAGAAVTVRGLAGGPVVGQLLVPGIDLDVSAVGAAPGGSVVRELCFVAPSLAGGETVALTVDLGATRQPAPTDFAWVDAGPTRIDLRLGGQPVLGYHRTPYDKNDHMETNKVFHHVYDPGDPSRLLTNGLGAKQYPHHRGVMYGFNKTTYTAADGTEKTVDTWHLPVARQVDAGTVRQEAGPVAGRHVVQIYWYGEGDAMIGVEYRQVTAYRVSEGWLIDWASDLHALEYTVRLDGDPQHAGFHFRANPQVADENAEQTYYLRTDGAGLPNETRNWDGNHQDFKNYPWLAMCFLLDGQRYTVAYLDNSKNPKEARYSERNYGRFGSYFEYTLQPYEALLTRYRLAVRRGELTVDQASALSADFEQPATGG